MARILCNVAGGGKPLKGNAETGDVLVGKTFSNKQSNALTGSMPNNGAWSASTSGNGSVTIPAGYHNGSGSVSGAASYNKGVSDADKRVNTSSASYSNGYNSGVSAADKRVNTSSASYSNGYSAGYAKGNSHVTYKDFHVTAQAASENADSSTTFNAHLNGYTMIGYGFIKTGGVGWNWWRPYHFDISNSGEKITVGVSGGGGGYDSTDGIPSRWKNLDCTVRVFYK